MSRLKQLPASIRWGAGAFLVSLLLYVSTLAPGLTTEDSGELITAAYLFRPAHPPGYPIWVLLCSGFAHVFAIGEFAFRCNLFSALCTASAIGGFVVVLTQFGIRPWASFLGSLAVGTSPVVWSQAVVTEVYGLNALLCTVVLLCLSRWYAADKTIWLVWGCLAFGLAMSNHQTAAYLGLPAAAWVLWRRPRLATRPALVLGCFVAFAAGLLPHSFLVLRRALPGTPLAWGQGPGLAGLWRYVSRIGYAEIDRQTGTAAELLPTWAEYRMQEWSALVKILATYGGWILIGGAVCCLVVLWWRRKTVSEGERAAVGLFGSVIALSFFVHPFLTNFDPANPVGYWLSRVYFIPTYLALGCLSAVGLQIVSSRAGVQTRSKSLVAGGLAALLLVIGAAAQFDERDQSNDHLALTHGGSILRSLPANALYFPIADADLFPLLYLTLIEGRRPDVRLASYTGLIRSELYATMPNPPQSFAESALRQEEIRDWVLQNQPGPAFFGSGGKLGNDLRRMPQGIVFEVVRPDDNFVHRAWPLYSYPDWMDTGRAFDWGYYQIKATYYFMRAANHVADNEPKQAIATLAKVDPRLMMRDLSLSVAGILSALGEYRQALAIVERLRSRHPAWPKVYQVWAQIETQAANGPAHEQALLGWSRADLDDPRPSRLLGDQAITEGNVSKARYHWRQSLKRDRSQRDLAMRLEQLGP